MYKGGKKRMSRAQVLDADWRRLDREGLKEAGTFHPEFLHSGVATA